MARQKNSSWRPLVSVFKGALAVIPDEWRAKLGFTQTQQKQPIDVAPSAVSGTAVESRVEQELTDERKKVDVVLGDPTGQSLSEVRFTEHGTLATTVRTLVGGSTTPSYLTEEIAEHDLGNGYKDLRVTTSPSFGTRPGQYYDEQRNFLVGFVEQLVAKNDFIGTAKTEVTPISDVLYRRRTITTPSQSDLDSARFSFAGNIDLSADLPQVLRGISVVYNKQSGSGFGGIPASNISAVAVGTSGSVQESPSGRAQASGGIIPELVIDIYRPWARKVPCVTYVFSMLTPVTRTSMLSKVATFAGTPVHDWPKFQPEPLTIIALSENVSLSAEAQAHARLSYSTSEASGESYYGGGRSEENGLSNHVVDIPECVHDAITIKKPTATVTVSVRAEASLLPITSIGHGGIGGVTNVFENTKDVNATVIPSYIPATGGVTSIPTSGLYLADLRSEPGPYGTVSIAATIVDFTYFARA